MINKYVLIFPLLFPALSVGGENDADMINALIVKAKVAGTCGAMSQLSNFQRTTNMPGGDEFVLRFFRTEATRLGMDLKQFLESCDKITKEYAAIQNSLNLPK